MAVALVLDFPGATREQYEEAVERMHLDGQPAPGGEVHVAGPQGDGWRVIDVWDGMEPFERFRDDQIIPISRAVGMPAPQVRVVEVDDGMPPDGSTPAFAQFVRLPGLDRKAFRLLHAEAVPGGARPEGLSFHVNGPFEDGWCVIDGWVSGETRDRFMERTRTLIEAAPLSGPPAVEEMPVEGAMARAAAAHA